jgi:hypothetical protein
MNTPASDEEEPDSMERHMWKLSVLEQRIFESIIRLRKNDDAYHTAKRKIESST